ncbi:hypothetical protein JTE90_022467 [Oedothorax gibbosus]|uniref:Transposase n=1 Tax=Oedothorax gibbosus TaxID=931172 RepID=A0AAV6TW94_9ARAC|nr:hypothetical protein JTE90_022467 [Oedothorax gibbosus]
MHHSHQFLPYFQTKQKRRIRGLYVFYKIIGAANRNKTENCDDGLRKSCNQCFCQSFSSRTDLWMFFFHFKQCIWRKIQSITGFQERYNNEDELNFQTNLKKLSAIAFLPVTEVIPVYEQLCDSEFSEDEFSPLLDYIDDTWIGRILRGHRRWEPTFPLHIWNQNDNVKDSLEKTNNSVEGWHNAFRLLVGSSHPTIWKIIIQKTAKCDRSKTGALRKRG